jgi:hypothetical protein
MSVSIVLLWLPHSNAYHLLPDEHQLFPQFPPPTEESDFIYFQANNFQIFHGLLFLSPFSMYVFKCFSFPFITQFLTETQSQAISHLMFALFCMCLKLLPCYITLDAVNPLRSHYRFQHINDRPMK